MTDVALLGAADPLTKLLEDCLRRYPGVGECSVWRRPQPPDAGWLTEQGCATVVYGAASRGAAGGPDLHDAGAALTACADAGIDRVVVLSSAAVHAPSHKHPGRVAEAYVSPRNVRDPIAAAWVALETAVRSALESTDAVVTLLRPATVLLAGSDDYFNRTLGGRWAMTLAGHDPTMQFLAAADLGAAVCAAVERAPGGVLHVAPAESIPWRKALRLAAVHRLPLPRWVHRVVRSIGAPLGIGAPMHVVDRSRYSWTISGERAERELGLAGVSSSAHAIAGLAPSAPADDGSTQAGRCDDFGMDLERIARWRRGHLRFLHDIYWRVELDGTDNLPRRGAAVVVGLHRGLMPFDGVMAVHAIVEETGRCPRFLIHPTLVKFPFLASYMFKLGGVIACRDNGAHVLDDDGLLAVFPEGIGGAFTLYRDAHRLAGFGRPEYVRLALRHQAPIVPFVTVGSAEIFPILKKIDWRWWRRFSEWPAFPLTPTFPWLPVPLPSKWHTQFLTPIPIPDLYPPEAANDAAIVDSIDQQVQERMAAKLKELVAARPAIFYGSIFERERGHGA